ncbi:MAG: hypothetical protein ACXVCR_11570 [Bdellovibrio sp.]
MPYKRRSKEEIENILKDYAADISEFEICSKYSLSGSGFRRILAASRGENPHSRKVESKISRLEKKLKEQEKEIALLKAALKKS